MDAGGHSCGARIAWLKANMGKSEQEARQQVAAEFPAECGPCGVQTSPPADDRLPAGNKCGFACNHNRCTEINQALGIKYPYYEYGGACSMNLFMPDGFGTDLQACESDFFLWDEPFTQSHRGKPEWGNMDYIVEQWRKFTSLNGMSERIQNKRAAGMKVTSPLFTGGETIERLEQFFFKCGPGCNDPNSPLYIDVLAWNAWIGDWSSDYQGQVNWIEQTSQEMKRKFGNRPVWLSNYGFLGPAGTTTKQVDALTRYGIFDKAAIDRVYYFSAIDVGGGTVDGTNSLLSADIRSAYLSKCATS